MRSFCRTSLSRRTVFVLAVMLSQVGAGLPVPAAPIPGLFNTGVNESGAPLPNSSVDPHYRLAQSADATSPGPNAIVVLDTLFPIVAGPWLATSPTSKWIGPKADQSVGSAFGNYTYRISFDLAGLDPSTAVITGRWSSDNGGVDILINGVSTGITGDGNFGTFTPQFAISSGFAGGSNALDFIVNNASTTVNPTGFRAEISGTAELLAPPGTPASIISDPSNRTVNVGSSTFFSAQGYGSLPLAYQWRLGNVPIPGATGTAYTVACAMPSDAGPYTLVVTNAFGGQTSMVATLTVVGTVPPPLSPAQRTYEPPGPSSRRTAVTFTEIQYHPTNRVDGRNLEFVELYNSNPYFEDIGGWRISGDIDFTFPSNTILQANSYLVVAPVPTDVQAVYGINGVLGGFTNRLDNNGGILRLRKRSGAIVLEVHYSDDSPWPVAADGTGHSLVLARPTFGENDPRAWAASAVKGGSPGAADPVPIGPLENVVINEVLAHTDLPVVDFVELYNHSAVPADLSGCWLSDDPATNKFRIPNGTTLAPRGFLAFDENQLGFALDASGETIYLVNSNNTRVVAALEFEGQASGISIGRFPDGADRLHELATPTRGTTNAPLLLRPVVINEIMYHPISGRNDDTYVELHNRGATSVNIGGWRFVDGIDFTFPPGWTIPAGGYMVVAENASRLMTNYSGLNAGNVIGNFSGSLSHGGERIALGMPDFVVRTNHNGTNAVILSTNRFYVVVNEVTYSDGGRWGRWADRGGSSLELVDPRADNRLAPNWADSDESGKAGWTLVEATGLTDNTTLTADRLQVMLLGAGEALLDDVEALYQGVNRVSNTNFEAGLTGWTVQGTHSKSGWETAQGYNSARSLRLRSSDRGDHAANRAFAPLTAGIPPGSSATLRARVKWLRGHPEILLRLKGNGLESFGRLSTPGRPGTPGTANSTAVPNAGPAIIDVSHRPALPAALEAVRVTARVHDPDGLAGVTLKYRVDGAGGATAVAMRDDGSNCDDVAGDGVFTGIIPGQSADRIVAFYVEAADLFGPPATTRFPNDAPARECLVYFGASVPGGGFASYRLLLTSATISTWATREKLSNEDLDGTFVYGSNRVVYNVGARYSGSSYTAPSYTSPIGALCGYDIIFPDDDLFLGDSHIILDWPVRDDTNQREQTQYWFLEQMGLPNMYRRNIIMFVNNIRRGNIYDDTQQPGASTLAEWFPDDPDGTLVKTDCWNEFNDAGDRENDCILNTLALFNTTGGVKKTARYRWNWRPRAGDGTENDFTDFFHLVDAANLQVNYQASVECVADMEHWARTFACNDLSSYWDAFGNSNGKNTYLYKPQRAPWKLMCWDFDVGLGTFGDAIDNPLFNANDALVTRMIPQNAAWTRLYWNALSEAVNTFFQTGPGTKLDALLDAKYAAFVASGMGQNNPSAIKSWIGGRRNNLVTWLGTNVASFAVAGPVSFSTNRNLVTLTGTAPITVHTLTVNGVAVTPVWTTLHAWRITVPVMAGANALTIVGRDRYGNVISGASSTIAVTYTGVDDSPVGNIVINEIMYNPVIPEASFIELFNLSANTAFDLSGWRLNGIDFTFPSGTVLSNRGFLVICKNRTAFASAYGWGVPVLCEFDGHLDDGGETLSLIKPGATPAEDLLVDRVTYDDDPPWPPLADGLGPSLQLVDATQDNNRPGNWSDGAGWRRVVVTANPGASTIGQLSLLLTNLASDCYIDDIWITPGMVPESGTNYVANGGFESPSLAPWNVSGIASASAVVTDVVHSGNQSLHLVYAAGSATLMNFFQYLTNVVPTGLVPNATNTLSFWMRPGTNSLLIQARVNSFLRANYDARPGVPTPGAPNLITGTLPPYPLLWLSEIQPRNVSTRADNAGDFDPWIELHNGGSTNLALDDFTLSDSYADLGKWAFPPGISLAPGEFLLVWADAEPGETAGTNLHANFRLNPTNGAVALSRTVGEASQLIDYLNYSDVGADHSFGAWPPDQGSYRQTFNFATPLGTNDPSALLYINEWMAANTGIVTDPADYAADDWFEIYNPTAMPVDLSGFYLTDTNANPTKFTVPAGVIVPAQGYLLVWADEESGQTEPGGDLHVNFRLNQLGESIELRDPSGRLLDAVSFGEQTNNISQGRWPDGAAEVYFMTVPTPRGPNFLPSVTPTIHILDVSFSPPSSVTLAWDSEPAHIYRVQFKNALTDAAWTDLPGDVPASGPTATKTDSSLGANTQRFYRIQFVQ